MKYRTLGEGPEVSAAGLECPGVRPCLQAVDVDLPSEEAAVFDAASSPAE